MSPKPVPFGKYDDWGAYHWVECDRHSASYNPPLEARYKAVAKSIAARMGRAKRVLDVGCGDGYLMGLVSTLCESLVGIDSEPTAVRLAADKLRAFPNSTVIQASCYGLPFSAGCFEVVILADVIEHLDSPEACLREVRRILIPNGSLLVTTPKRRSDRKLGWGHVKEYTAEELADCLQEHFSQVTMVFLWPHVWFRMYGTRVGWRLIRIFSRHLFNPFLRESSDAASFDQILAVCEQPRR